MNKPVLSSLLLISLSACSTESAKAPMAPRDIAGVWQLNGGFGNPEYPYLGGRFQPRCVFDQNGEQVTGYCKGPTSEGRVEGTIQGSRLRFVWTHFARPDPVSTSIALGMDYGGSGRDEQGHATSRMEFTGEVGDTGLLAGRIMRLEFPLKKGLFKGVKLSPPERL